MAIIKKSEFKKLQKNEIESKMIELKKELMKLNSQIAVGTVPENPGKIRELKKTLARLIMLSDQIKKKPKEAGKKVD